MSKQLLTFIVLICLLIAFIQPCAATQIGSNNDTHQHAAANQADVGVISATEFQQLNIEHAQLVFFDIWALIDQPSRFQQLLPQSTTKHADKPVYWVQRPINIDQATLAHYRSYFPAIEHLVFDNHFTLMQQYQVWQAPYYVILEQGKPIFKGELAQFNNWLAGNVSNKQLKHQLSVKSESTQPWQAGNKKRFVAPNRPSVGTAVAALTMQTLEGVSIPLRQLAHQGTTQLIFIDAMCPFPHFPNCEAKLAALNKQVQANPDHNWIAVFNSFYVDEQTVKGFAEQFQLTIPIVFDANRQLFDYFDVLSTPYKIEIDQQGYISQRVQM